MIDTVPWWRLGLCSLGAITLAVAGALVGIIALAFLGVDFTEYLAVPRPTWIRSGLVAFWFAFTILAQMLAPLAVLSLLRPVRPLLRERLIWPEDGAGALTRVGQGALLAVGVQWLWVKVGPAPDPSWQLIEHLIYAVARGGAFWPWFWLLLTVVAVGPVAEELLYRGLAQGYLRRRWGVPVGMVGSALLFGLSHGLTNALPAALLGLWFAYQAEKDRSLVGAMLLHALHNLAAVLIIAAR